MLFYVIPACVSLFCMTFMNVCWGKAGRVVLSLQVNALTEGDIICLFLSYPKQYLIIPWNAILFSSNDREHLVLKYPTAWDHSLASPKTKTQIKSPVTQTNVLTWSYMETNTPASLLKESNTCAQPAAKAYLSLSRKSNTSTCRRVGVPKMSSRCSPPLPDKIRAACTSEVTLALRELNRKLWKLRPLMSCKNFRLRC